MAEQHRKNISSAIKEKWADPEYRMRVSCGMKDGIVQHKRVSTARVSSLSSTSHFPACLLACLCDTAPVLPWSCLQLLYVSPIVVSCGMAINYCRLHGLVDASGLAEVKQ